MIRQLAIIGGGAAAATLVCELLSRRPPHPLRVDWYTGAGTPARGVAYGTASPRHLLNVRAASMSLFAGTPGGFLDFVQREEPTRAGTEFLPRHRYGDYLEAEVARLLRQGSAQGHDVQIVPYMVDALVPEHGGIRVIHREQSRQVQAAVLALGTLPPQALAGVADAVLASGRYLVDPWPLLANPDCIKPAPRHVALIGLGLTAVDVLLELSARWPQTRFTAISRHGLFPEAHSHSAAAPTSDGAGLVSAMRELPVIRHWMRVLRETIAQGGDWRTVIDGLRPHTPILWQELPDPERARFLRHARWAWERARHRMAPQTRDSMTTLELDGRLQRRRGRVRAADLSGDNQVQLTLSGRDYLEATTVDADLVIQTVGLDTDVSRTAHPLLRQLLDNAYITPDPFGLGLRAEPDGRVWHDDEAWPNLFALGSLLRGTLWESTAMPEIRQQARRLADQLLAN